MGDRLDRLEVGVVVDLVDALAAMVVLAQHGGVGLDHRHARLHLGRGDPPGVAQGFLRGGPGRLPNGAAHQPLQVLVARVPVVRLDLGDVVGAAALLDALGHDAPYVLGAC